MNRFIKKLLFRSVMLYHKVVSTTNNNNYCTFLQHLEHCVKQQKGNFPIFGSEFDAFFSFHRELQIHNRVGAKYQAVRYSFNAVIY